MESSQRRIASVTIAVNRYGDFVCKAHDQFGHQWPEADDLPPEMEDADATQLARLAPPQEPPLSLPRQLALVCPTCGHHTSYRLAPTEGVPLVTVVTCPEDGGGCGTPFAVEVRMTITMETSTCRLHLPSTTPVDCLNDDLPELGSDPTRSC
jgi:hypothetical protein